MNKFNNTCVKGMLRSDGRRMKNEDGQEVLLRGWGAGNWTNPEGFMLGIGTEYMGSSMSPKLALPGRFQSGRSMSQTIRELCGSAYADTFWPRWHANHLGEADIRAMAELGYNSIRLPITAWILMPEEPEITFDEVGFQMIDRVLDWCEKYKLYAILDLHGAAGGQSGLCCDDGLDNVPHMFFEPESYERTLILWEELARRYADRWIVGGYDLLNEPISITRWHYLMPQLAKFYDDAIERIRKHDQNHIVFLEGPMFSTNMQIFDRAYDPICNNWAIAIHLYGFSPEVRDLYKFLEVAYRLDVPIWIGEGRSKDEDMSVFYEIAAEQDIGFNLWSWKSVTNDEDSGAVHYDLPDGFDAVLKYVTEGGARPSYKESQRLFDEMLEVVRYENCHKNQRVHIYCQRQQGVVLSAAGYDGGEADVGFSSGWRLGNPLKFRTEDGTKLVLKDGMQVEDRMGLPGSAPSKPDPLGMLLLELSTGKFACYTVREIKSDCQVTLMARSASGAVLSVSENGRESLIEIPAGSDMHTYPACTLKPADACTVKLCCVEGTVQLESIEFGK